MTADDPGRLPGPRLRNPGNEYRTGYADLPKGNRTRDALSPTTGLMITTVIGICVLTGPFHAIALSQIGRTVTIPVIGGRVRAEPTPPTTDIRIDLGHTTEYQPNPGRTAADRRPRTPRPRVYAPTTGSSTHGACGPRRCSSGILTPSPIQILVFTNRGPPNKDTCSAADRAGHEILGPGRMSHQRAL
jgi:hypothetical protein